jgi:hypothetical protein
MINARSETAATKPAYRSSFRARRCLIVADGFYEWQARDGRKQPGRASPRRSTATSSTATGSCWGEGVGHKRRFLASHSGVKSIARPSRLITPPLIIWIMIAAVAIG